MRGANVAPRSTLRKMPSSPAPRTVVPWTQIALTSLYRSASFAPVKVRPWSVDVARPRTFRKVPAKTVSPSVATFTTLERKRFRLYGANEAPSSLLLKTPAFVATKTPRDVARTPRT